MPYNSYMATSPCSTGNKKMTLLFIFPVILLIMVAYDTFKQ